MRKRYGNKEPIETPTEFPKVQIDSTSYTPINELIESMFSNGQVALPPDNDLEYDIEPETTPNENTDDVYYNADSDPTNNLSFDKIDAIETKNRLENELTDKVNEVSRLSEVSNDQSKNASKVDGSSETTS